MRREEDAAAPSYLSLSLWTHNGVLPPFSPRAQLRQLLVKISSRARAGESTGGLTARLYFDRAHLGINRHSFRGALWDYDLSALSSYINRIGPKPRRPREREPILFLPFSLLLPPPPPFSPRFFFLSLSSPFPPSTESLDSLARVPSHSLFQE